MNTNSINSNGCSVCEQGKENYTTFRSTHRPKRTFYQYDYRHTNGELFSTVAPTLADCRNRRDEWLKKKSKMYKLFVGFTKLGEFTSISEAKTFADNSEYNGVFNILGKNYRDSWYGIKSKKNSHDSN